VDFTRGELRIARTVQNGKVEEAGKTDAALRTVKLQAVALNALRELTRHLAGGLIFPAPGGGIINLSNYRKRVWKKALKDASVEYWALDNTRHTFATLTLAANVPIEDVSALLGHTNIAVTLRHYARWLPAAEERNIALMDAFAASALSVGRKMDGRQEADDVQ
jgi:integrase